MSEVKPEVVDRMVALVRHAAVSASGHTQEEAQRIIADLPHPDLEEARKIARGWLIYDDASTLQADEPAMRAILRAIKRGRELATSETDQLGGVGV